MGGGDIARVQGSQPGKGFRGSVLAACVALETREEGMQASREGRELRETEQDLVEQVCSTLGKGNAEDDRPALLRLGQRAEARPLDTFFSLVQEGTEIGFQGHFLLEILDARLVDGIRTLLDP